MSMKYRVVDNSKKVIAEFNRKKERGLKAVGAKAVNHAQTPIKAGGHMPVKTSRLRNSIDYEVSGDDVYIGTNVEYAPYQELGTSKGISAKHFLKHAASDHNDEYRDIFKKSMES